MSKFKLHSICSCVLFIAIFLTSSNAVDEKSLLCDIMIHDVVAIRKWREQTTLSNLRDRQALTRCYHRRVRERTNLFGVSSSFLSLSDRCLGAARVSFLQACRTQNNDAPRRDTARCPSTLSPLARPTRKSLRLRMWKCFNPRRYLQYPPKIFLHYAVRPSALSFFPFPLFPLLPFP